MIPPPPLIHTFSPLPSFLPSSPLFQQSENISKSQYENLNPNVPEFVPVNLASASDGELSDAEEVLENGDGESNSDELGPAYRGISTEVVGFVTIGLVRF